MTDEPSALDDLSNEKELLKKIKHFKNQVTQLENIIKPFCESDIYSDLSTEDRVKHDLFLAYSLTSLYWMYVRTGGVDPFTHTVKTEVDRVQEYVSEYQRIKDRKKAPHVDVAAAKRFIKHGLYDADKPPPTGKRKTFENSDDEDN